MDFDWACKVWIWLAHWPNFYKCLERLGCRCDRADLACGYCRRVASDLMILAMPLPCSPDNYARVGRKRWALYPPGSVPPGVTFSSLPHPSCQHVDFNSAASLTWFLEVLPTLEAEDLPLEFIQEPGDIVFIPAGWWHSVLNLDTSIAITHNFVSRSNLEDVVGSLAQGAYHHLSRTYGAHEEDILPLSVPRLGCR